MQKRYIIIFSLFLLSALLISGCVTPIGGAPIEVASPINEEDSICLLPMEENIPKVIEEIDKLSFIINENKQEIDVADTAFRLIKGLSKINPDWKYYEEDIEMAMRDKMLKEYGLACSYKGNKELSCVYREANERDSLETVEEEEENKVVGSIFDNVFEFEDKKLLKIDSEDPQEILKIIEKNDPYAYERIGWALRYLGKSYGDVSYCYRGNERYKCGEFEINATDVYLKYIAEATRLYYERNPTGMFKVLKNTEETPLNIIAQDAYFPDFLEDRIPRSEKLWRSLIETCLDIIPKANNAEDRRYLGNCNHLFRVIKFVGFNEDRKAFEYDENYGGTRRTMDLLKDEVVRDKLLEIQERNLVEGRGMLGYTADGFVERITEIYYIVKDKEGENFSSTEFSDKIIEPLYNFYYELEKIDAPVGGGFRALRLDRYVIHDEEENIRGTSLIDVEDYINKRAPPILRLVDTLVDRGELNIEIILEHIRYGMKGEISEGKIDKLLILHNYYGILSFYRLQDNEEDLSIIDYLIENVNNPDLDKDKPIALILTPREPIFTFSPGKVSGGASILNSGGPPITADAFVGISLRRSIKELMGKYNVLVYETASDRGIEDILKYVYETKGKKISLVILAGHGSKEAVLLYQPQLQPILRESSAKYKYPRNTDEMFIDFSDEDIIKKWGRYISEDGKIIMLSCETGESGIQEDNIMSFIALNLRGRTVYGPQEEITGVRFIFENGKVIDLLYVDERKGQGNELVSTHSIILAKNVSK